MGGRTGRTRIDKARSKGGGHGPSWLLWGCRRDHSVGERRPRASDATPPVVRSSANGLPHNTQRDGPTTDFQRDGKIRRIHAWAHEIQATFTLSLIENYSLLSIHAQRSTDSITAAAAASAPPRACPPSSLRRGSPPPALRPAGSGPAPAAARTHAHRRSLRRPCPSPRAPCHHHACVHGVEILFGGGQSARDPIRFALSPGPIQSPKIQSNTHAHQGSSSPQPM